MAAPRPPPPRLVGNGDAATHSRSRPYAAQRLRRPPEGYGWFAVDGAFLLASLSSGLILDVAE